METELQMSLFLKRVQRELKLSDDHADFRDYVFRSAYTQVGAVTGGVFTDSALRAAKKQLPNPADIGRAFKEEYAEYKFENAKPDPGMRVFLGDTEGFVIFERAINNVTGFILILLSAAVTFRLFPLPLYAAYAVCAAVTLGVAWFAHWKFYKRSVMLWTLLAPALLLLFFPVRDAVSAAHYSEASFFSALFHADNAIVFTLAALFVLFFFLGTMFFHARAYLLRSSRKWATGAAVGLLVLSVSLYALCAAVKQTEYTKDAAVIHAQLTETFDLYHETGDIDAAVRAADTLNTLYQRHIPVYRGALHHEAHSYFSVLKYYALYASGDVALIQYFHPGFDPEKDAFFDYDALHTGMAAFFAETADALAAGASGDVSFRTLIRLHDALATQPARILALVYDLHTQWVYSG